MSKVEAALNFNPKTSELTIDTEDYSLASKTADVVVEIV